MGFAECLLSPFCRGEGFFVFGVKVTARHNKPTNNPFPYRKGNWDHRRAGLSTITRLPCPCAILCKTDGGKLKDQLMLKVCSLGLALAGLFVCFTGSAQYANSVISYTGGIGGNPLLTDPTRALGAPTGFIGYQDADPFNPP